MAHEPTSPDHTLDASVVLPTYNEALNLPHLVPQICETLREAGIRAEVVVVDDDSPDGTWRVAEELATQWPVRVLRRRSERGLATAVMAGFASSDATVCVVMDADGSHPVERLPAMIHPVIRGEADATVGSRYMPGGSMQDWPWYRLLVSKTAGWMAWGLTTMSDPTSGFMAIRRSLLAGARLEPTGWKIVLETIVKARPPRVLDVPILFRDRVAGNSKMGLREQRDYLRHLARLYAWRFRTAAQLVQFSLVGLSGVAVDMVVVAVVMAAFGLDVRLGAVFGFAAAVTSNYSFNRAWTFRETRARPWGRGLGVYAAVALASLGVRLAVMHGLIETLSLTGGGWGLLTNFVGICVAMAVNFSGARWLAFRAEPQAGDRSPEVVEA